MCGIAGFSLSVDSTINARKLSNAMLTAIEDRGYMASGYAFHHEGVHGYHSAAQPGSSLPLKFMPRKARTVILHTRLATHGAVTDNRNNHPVTSPAGNIALVHNGVIYNHNQVRSKVDGNLPDVDTSVIPAVIEQQGVASLNLLDGDAAIAWLDKRDQGTLHLARYQHSPLCVAQLEDGSFVFASTEQLLWRVLIQLNLMPTWMHNPAELEYYTIRDGRILSRDMLPEPLYTGSAYDYSYFRHQTSGARGMVGGSAYSNYTYWDDDEDTYWDDYTESWMTAPTEAPSCTTTTGVRNNNQKYWTQIREELALRSDVLFYADNERELWLNELYLYANAPDLDLLDYGTVAQDGTLLSDQEDALF
jgi:hypothetical protein